MNDVHESESEENQDLSTGLILQIPRVFRCCHAAILLNEEQ